MDKWIVAFLDEGKKLIPFLKQKYKDAYTLKQIRFAIEHNRCMIDGVVERFASKRLCKGSIVEIEIFPHFGFAYEKERLLFEDDYFIAYDKPPLIPSVYGLDEVLIPHFGPLFPVHRLDRDTTGVLLFAKTAASQSKFEDLFRNRLVKKTYSALVLGAPLDSKGIVEMKMAAKKTLPGKTLFGQHRGGKFSKTYWRCEKRGEHFSQLTCIPVTGRTHQIRIHLEHIGHPIVGDFDYGSRKLPPFLKPIRIMLHASELTFSHPFLSESISLSASLPPDFQEMLTHL